MRRRAFLVEWRAMGPIVVGTDGSQHASLAVERAAQIAEGAGATVHLVCALHDIALREPLGNSARSEHVDLGGVAESVLSRAERTLLDRGVTVETHTRQGEPAEVILDVAKEVDAELIVVGARGLSGLSRFLLGSVSTKLSHYADRSVLVVRQPGM